MLNYGMLWSIAETMGRLVMVDQKQSCLVVEKWSGISGGLCELALLRLASG